MENKLLPPYSLVVSRDDLTVSGTLDHHIFLHLDTICESAQIPKIDVLTIDEDSDPFISRGFNNELPGFYLHLPSYLTTFLSYSEIQILIHWCFLNATERFGSPLTSLLNCYPQEQAAAMLIKVEALKTSWTEFKYSGAYLEAKNGHPLVAYLETSVPKKFLSLVSSEIESNKQIFRLLKTFDKTTLTKFLHNCGIIEYNQIFSLENIDYYNFSYEIFEEKREPAEN